MTERIARILLREGRPSLARDGARQAIGLETARGKVPDNPRCRELLASHLDLLTEACLRLGEHAEAAAAVRRGLTAVNQPAPSAGGPPDSWRAVPSGRSSIPP